jgi:hypothetical protein
LCTALSALSPAAPRAQEEPALPAEYLAHVRQGREYLEIHNTFRAAAEFQMALRVYADDVAAWEGLARAGFVAGEEELATLALLRAIELAPNRAEFRLLLGDIHARAGRRLAAVHGYLEYERCVAQGDRVDAGQAASVRRYIERAVTSDPEVVEKARQAAAQPGPPTTLRCRYLAHAPTDATMRREGSVFQGETLDPKLLRAAAFDEQGFPAGQRLGWSASAGLTLVAEADPPTLQAIARPWNAKLTVGAMGASSPLLLTVPIHVIGPAARIAVRPAKAEVQAGERVHFLVAAMDEVGHRLWLPEVEWLWEATGPHAPGRLRRDRTTQPPAHFFEPHRNVFDVASDPPPPPGTAFRIVAREKGGKVQGAALCTVVPGVAAERDRPGGIAFLDDHEAAVAAAAKADKPLLVEFTAEW